VGCTREREPLRKEIEELRREEPLELEREEGGLILATVLLPALLRVAA